jgi:hypothetical protein
MGSVLDHEHAAHAALDEAEVALRLLARGFRELHLQTRSGGIVDPAALPAVLGSALEKLSRLCLLGGAEDIGDSVHVISDLARRLPVGQWGIPAFAPPFPHSEVRLLTIDPAAPSEECLALSVRGRAEDVWEDIHHRQLRDVVQSVREQKRMQAYSQLRGWVVRNPVYERRALSQFIEESGLIIAEETLTRWSEHIPLGAVGRDGKVKLCANCGGLLYPHRDMRAFPDGRCRIGPCLEEAPSSRAERIIEDPASWRVFADDILAYWVGPGLAEVSLHDALKKAGIEVELYPRDDLVDVGHYDEIGIDVKSYSSPRFLGEVLTDRLGGLVEFDRRFVAVPDGIVNRRPGYLEELRDTYRGPHAITFCKVSQVLEILAA